MYFNYTRDNNKESGRAVFFTPLLSAKGLNRFKWDFSVALMPVPSSGQFHIGLKIVRPAILFARFFLCMLSLLLTENLIFRINKLTMLICFYSSKDTPKAVFNYWTLLYTLNLKSGYILKVKMLSFWRKDLDWLTTTNNIRYFTRIGYNGTVYTPTLYLRIQT